MGSFPGAPPTFSPKMCSTKPQIVTSCGAFTLTHSLYLENYAALNPLFPAALFFLAGDVYSQVDIIPHVEMRKSRLYKEWMEPQGYIDFIASTIDKSASTAAFLTVIRHRRDGLVSDETRQQMRLIAPHVRRAVLIAKVIDLNKVEATTLASTLDGLAAGVSYSMPTPVLSMPTRRGLP